MEKSHYKKLGIVLGINTVVMFVITFVMIDRWEHFLPNINRAYMALLMAAPMGTLMLVAMRGMFPNRKLNLALHAGFAAVFVLCFLGVRRQAPVGDDQFLRSMIPHHSGAITMCEEAAIKDQEVLKLCDQIVQSQKEEIAQMQQILKRR